MDDFLKAFNEIQQPFMIKTLKKIMIGGYLLNMITHTHARTRTHTNTRTTVVQQLSHLPNWETLKAYPGRKQAYPPTTNQHYNGGFSKCNLTRAIN